MKQNLSASLEDYLEAIAQLTAVEGHAHTKEIAEKLNVKMPSVTGALRQLEKMGYIVYNAHYPVVLTEEGERIAKEVMHRHKVLTGFFTELLGLTPEKASATACHLEHVVDSDTIGRFVMFSKAIERRTDAKPFQRFLSEAMQFLSDTEKSDCITLAEMEQGSYGILIQTGINLPDTGNPLPLKTGERFLCTGHDGVDPGNITIHKEGKTFSIPLETAENLWVRPC